MTTRAAGNKVAGSLLVLVSATGYGLLALFGTLARGAGLSEIAVMALRFTLAALALWPVVAVRRPAAVPRPALVAALALGGLCWSIQSVAYLLAVVRVGSSTAGLLLYTYPVLVVTAAVLLGRQQWHAGFVVALGLVLAGLALVLGAGFAFTGLETSGVIAGLVAAITYTTFILASEPLSERIDPFLFTALAMTGAACTTVVLTLARGDLDLKAVGSAGFSLLGLAVLSTVVPALTFLLGLRHIGAPAAAVLSCTEVVVTCTVAHLALGDHLTPAKLAGCGAIIAAVVVLNRWRAKS